MANFQAQDYIHRVSPNLTLLKAVRIRPSDLPKLPGGFDEWLTVVANLDDKKIYCVAYKPNYISDNVTIDKIELDPYTANISFTDYVKNKLGRKWPDKIAVETALLDEILGLGLKNQQGTINDYKIIQDPLDTNVVPPQEVKAVEPEQPTTKPDTTGAGNSTPPPTTVSTPPTKTIPIDPSTVTGKIILTKKSGPGDIVGETEVDIQSIYPNYGAMFSGIQFNEPGDYVISVTSTSPDVNPTEFKITVDPEPSIIPQDESRGKDDTSVSGSRPIIAQIDRPTLILPPINIPYDTSDKVASEAADSMGMFPLVSISGNPLQDRDIYSFKLYHSGILPKMMITFKDTTNLLRNDAMPKDNTTIDVFIESRTQELKPIHLKFNIEKIKDSVGQGGTYTILGTLAIPGGDNLYVKSQEVSTGTSFEVLRDICKKLGLGFNSNIDKTDDNMTWRHDGYKLYEVMQKIVDRSYINDTTYMMGYIDYYYCFNYVDVQKEYDRDNKSDVGIETGSNDKGVNTDKVTRVNLTNETSMNNSCFYFKADPQITNRSTEKNLKKGYRTITKYYDTKKKKFLYFTIEGTTKDGDTTHTLKAAKMDAKFYDENTSTIDLGKIDTDNVHKNYLYATELNRRNIDELSNIQMTTIMPNLNMNLYKSQKVNVTLVNTVPGISDPDRFKWQYCGDWIISDISFNVVMENGIKSFYQETKLIRKELSKTPEEINNGEKVLPKTPETNNEKTENPVVNDPNTDYKPGDVYRLKDKDGKEWLIMVELQNYDGTTIGVNLVSVEGQESNMVSESPQPIDEQSQKAADASVKESTTQPDIPPKKQDYKEVILGILNPQTDAAKAISGKITFETQGLEKRAIGSLTGFPDSGTINITGEYAEVTLDALTDEMRKLLQGKMRNKYNVNYELTIIEKKL